MSGDGAVCQAAEKVALEGAQVIPDAGMAGEKPSPAAYKKFLTDYDKALTASAAGAGNSPVAAAAKVAAAEAAKAAAAADPNVLTESPALEKANTDLSAACKAAGFPVSF